MQIREISERVMAKNRTARSTPEQLYSQLRAQAAGLLAEGRALSSFQHRGLSGIEREEPVRRFLRLHLPGRFHVGQGAIASSKRLIQGQHDIVVADRDLCYSLLNTISAQLVPLEAVHLIAEVRSRPGELNNVDKSLRKVRMLKPSIGIRQGEK